MMKSISLAFFIVSSLLGEQVSGRLKLNSACKLANKQKGYCRSLNDCPSAIEDFHTGKWPLICIDDPDMPIVCCDESKGSKPTPTTSTTTTTRKPPTNVRYEPGIISRQKCEEYSRWLLSPVSLGPNDRVAGQCGANVAPFIIGGTVAEKLEFPHMAHLGFGGDIEHLTWECGGSLISEKFVLTAAHCLKNRNGFNVSHVQLGKGDPGSIRTIKIQRVHKHPNYNPPQNYNDIALLELEKKVKFSDYRRPACVQVNRNFPNVNGTASGWGTTEKSKAGSKDLLKVSLPFMKHAECIKTFGVSHKLDRGIDDNTMICAGALNLNKDTCQGDSGGPLQIVLKAPKCMYSVVGLTSFGILCGIAPGVYTRVSAFVPWIESIVWPQVT